MDFEHSKFVDVDDELFYKDIRYFLSKLEFDMSVNVKGIEHVQHALETSKKMKFVDIKHVLSAIDQCSISLKENKPSRSFQYNPNVFYGGKPKW